MDNKDQSKLHFKSYSLKSNKLNPEIWQSNKLNFKHNEIPLKWVEVLLLLFETSGFNMLLLNLQDLICYIPELQGLKCNFSQRDLKSMRSIPDLRPYLYDFLVQMKDPANKRSNVKWHPELNIDGSQ